MTRDILDRIDSAVDALCACGCRQPITETSPSAYYATEDCHAVWWAQTRGKQPPPRIPRFRMDLQAQQEATAVLARAFAAVATALRQIPAPANPVYERMRNQPHGPRTQQRPPRQLGR